MGSTEQISEPFPARVWGWKRAPAFQVSKSSFLPQCHWRIWKEGNCAHCRPDQSTRPSSSISGAFSATIMVPSAPFRHSSSRSDLFTHLLSIPRSSHSLNPKTRFLFLFFSFFCSPYWNIFWQNALHAYAILGLKETADNVEFGGDNEIWSGANTPKSWALG